VLGQFNVHFIIIIYLRSCTSTYRQKGNEKNNNTKRKKTDSLVQLKMRDLECIYMRFAYAMVTWASAEFFRGGQIRGLGKKVPSRVQGRSPGECLGAHKPTTGCEIMHEYFVY